MTDRFKAILISRDEEKRQSVAVTELTEADLMEGDVTVAVPPGDAESLDAAVRGLLEGDDRAALAAAARQRIADWPDAAAVAGWLAALYEQVSLTTAADVVDTPD